MQSGSAVESLCAPVAKMAHKTASDAPLEHTGDHKRYGHVPGGHRNGADSEEKHHAETETVKRG